MMRASIESRLGSNHAPLNRDVFIVVQREHLIAAPTGRHMIHDDIFSVPSAQRVPFVVRSYPEIANDDIIGVDAKIAFDRNSVTGSCLSGDRNVVILDPDIAIDCPRDFKDDDSWSFGLAGIVQAARTRGVQVGDRNDSPAAPTSGPGAISFGTWKRWQIVGTKLW